jgi:hypothetical protein
MDPDPHSPTKLDLDLEPHKVNADPKHCVVPASSCIPDAMSAGFSRVLRVTYIKKKIPVPASHDMFFGFMRIIP